MGKNEKRFTITEKEGNGITGSVQIIVDNKTGVNYLWITQGNAGGLTVLVDREGKPVITAVTDFRQE